MGPRLFRRGNGFAFPDWPAITGVLQWGHAFSDVEMALRKANDRCNITLQWGHAFSDVEIKKMGVPTPYLRLASMGPRLFRRGNRGHFSGSPDAEKMAFFERLVFVSVPLAFSSRFCLGIRYQAPFRAVP